MNYNNSKTPICFLWIDNNKFLEKQSKNFKLRKEKRFKRKTIMFNQNTNEQNMTMVELDLVSSHSGGNIYGI